MRHVFDVGDHRAGRPHALLFRVVRNLVQLERVAALGEGHADVWLLQHVGNREDGALHVQGQQDLLAHELGPWLARRELDRMADAGVHHVVVKKNLARRCLRLEVFQPVEQLFRGVVRLVPDGIVARDAGAVGQHVAQRDRIVQEAVVEVDCRNGFADWLVPRQLAFFHEKSRRDGREQFRVRGDGVHRLRRNRQLLLVVAVAITLGEHELVIDDDADPDAWRVPVFQGLLHERIEARELSRDIDQRARTLVGCAALVRGSRRDDQRTHQDD